MNLLIGVTLCTFAFTSSTLLGGFGKVNVGDNDVQQVVDWTVTKINGMMNSLYHHVLLGTPRVYRQVVNGYNYHIVINMAPTSCIKNAKNVKKTVDECPVSNTDKIQHCNALVYDFHGKYSLSKFNCESKRDVERLGGDAHDYVPHGKTKDVTNHILGQDGHDYVQHRQSRNILSSLLGKDPHDYIPHTKLGSGLIHKSSFLLSKGADLLKHSQQAIHHMNIIGGDDTDYKPHQGDPCFQYVDDFQQFKAKYNRLYEGYEEQAKRFKIFCNNMERVKEYQRMENGSAVYGATIFADLSEEEFRKKYLGFKASGKPRTVWPAAEIPNGPIPDSWDWRNHDAVTPVKNQGSCGSCWAFSTTGNIEGANAIKHKKLVSLSEQELVDCDKIDDGCEGGLPSQAYEALMKLGGIEPENDYKYEGHDEKCHFDKSEVAVKLTGAVNISSDEGEMAAWLVKNGPISIGINAFAMQFYFGGIAHPWKIFCNPKNLDHGVLIVGYGKQGDEPYWIIKNSWGPHWGREGYYYVYRGGGVCGLNTMCTSAIVA